MTHDPSKDEYTRAADELEKAVRHDREAASHSERGEHVQAAHHAHIARGHFLNAQGMAHDAARRHADLFDDSVRAEHAVADGAVAHA